MSRTCDQCHSTLGPWEEQPCPLQRYERRPRVLSNADAAVLVLEKSDVPLRVYDIERGIARELGWAVNRGSLNVVLADDRRFCWGGRGIYGLVRHGLVPGPRNLVGIARFFVWSHQERLTLPELAFAMRYSGYSFSEQSLARALEDEAFISWTGDAYDVSRTFGETQELWMLGFATDHSTFVELASECAERIADALAERERRLRQ